MPITLTGRSLVYVFLLVICASIIALLIMALMNFIYFLIGHKKYIPIAHILRFKRDDVEKTSERVDEILKEDKPKRKRKAKV